MQTVELFLDAKENSLQWVTFQMPSAPRIKAVHCSKHAVLCAPTFRPCLSCSKFKFALDTLQTGVWVPHRSILAAAALCVLKQSVLWCKGCMHPGARRPLYIVVFTVLHRSTGRHFPHAGCSLTRFLALLFTRPFYSPSTFTCPFLQCCDSYHTLWYNDELNSVRCCVYVGTICIKVTEYLIRR
jgi:hypothetical protein